MAITIIVFKDNIICSDSRLTSGDTLLSDSRQKIFKNDKGWIGGCTGLMTDLEKFSKWFMSPNPKLEGWNDLKVDTETQAIIATTKGKVYEMCDTGYYENNVPYTTIGSGWRFAMGALEAGLSAQDAVMITIRLCISCGGPIQKERLDFVKDLK